MVHSVRISSMHRHTLKLAVFTFARTKHSIRFVHEFCNKIPLPVEDSIMRKEHKQHKRHNDINEAIAFILNEFPPLLMP